MGCYCKQCLKNGTKRSGGTIGLCWSHAKRRCRICGSVSAGEVYCEACNHETDLKRWTAQANLTIADPEIEDEQYTIRIELLSQAKRHLFVAIENGFLSLSKIVKAIHGKEPDKEIQDIKRVA